MLLFIILAVFVLALIGLMSDAGRVHGPKNKKEEDFFSDELARTFMSRRDYYNKVYLKSEAWQRKRYVVLKRDNWRCIYCGKRATQVHHKKYAKRNIGKEPIEWLVSVCGTCHGKEHGGWK